MKTSSRIKRARWFIEDPMRIVSRRFRNTYAAAKPRLPDYSNRSFARHVARLELRNKLYLAELRWVCEAAMAHYVPKED